MFSGMCGMFCETFEEMFCEMSCGSYGRARFTFLFTAAIPSSIQCKCR
jgi:hypothetical protein